MSQENGNWTPASEDYLRTSFPVHCACRDGDIEQLSSLLSTGDYDLYEEDDFYGWSPVHWAAYFGKVLISFCSFRFPLTRQIFEN